MEGRYEPVAIEEIEDGVSKRHSAVLNLNWRSEQGQLACQDPSISRPIATFDDEQDRTDREREGRPDAKAQIRELEEENRRLRSS